MDINLENIGNIWWWVSAILSGIVVNVLSDLLLKKTDADNKIQRKGIVEVRSISTFGVSPISGADVQLTIAKDIIVRAHFNRGLIYALFGMFCSLLSMMFTAAIPAPIQDAPGTYLPWLLSGLVGMVSLFTGFKIVIRTIRDSIALVEEIGASVAKDLTSIKGSIGKEQ